MLVVMIVLDIVIWKYRKYANLIVYCELFHACISAFLPLDFGDMANLTQLMAMLWIVVLHGCSMGHNCIASTLALTFIQLCPHAIVNNENINVPFVIGKLLNSIFLFLICSIIGMVVTYIAQIRGKMSQLLIENLNLLNKMHEGIIVVSEKDQSLKFAS